MLDRTIYCIKMQICINNVLHEEYSKKRKIVNKIKGINVNIYGTLFKTNENNEIIY